MNWRFWRRKPKRTTAQMVCHCGHHKCYHGFVTCFVAGCACTTYVESDLSDPVAEELERIFQKKGNKP